MKEIIIVILIVLAGSANAQVHVSDQKQQKMKVAVWDTYVTKKDGNIMHFDIIAPAEVKDTVIIYDYGKEYLKSKGQDGQPLTSKECRFCHIETVKPQWEKAINSKGYYVYEMENCD